MYTRTLSTLMFLAALISNTFTKQWLAHSNVFKGKDGSEKQIIKRELGF